MIFRKKIHRRFQLYLQTKKMALGLFGSRWMHSTLHSFSIDFKSHWKVAYRFKVFVNSFFALCIPTFHQCMAKNDRARAGKYNKQCVPSTVYTHSSNISQSSFFLVWHTENESRARSLFCVYTVQQFISSHQLHVQRLADLLRAIAARYNHSEVLSSQPHN